MKKVSLLFLLVGLVTVVSFGGGFYSIIADTDWAAVREVGFPRMLADERVFPILIFAAVMAIVFYTLYYVYRIMVPAPIPNGVDAPAKVIKVWDTGTTVNDDPQIGLLLEVTPAAGASFQIETKTLVSRLNAVLVQPGITATVRYDPDHPKRNRILELNMEPPAGGDAVARMQELRQRHLVSESEYQEKRKRILDNL
jgi:hypothetical protein